MCMCSRGLLQAIRIWIEHTFWRLKPKQQNVLYMTKNKICYWVKVITRNIAVKQKYSCNISFPLTICIFSKFKMDPLRHVFYQYKQNMFVLKSLTARSSGNKKQLCDAYLRFLNLISFILLQGGQRRGAAHML